MHEPTADSLDTHRICDRTPLGRSELLQATQVLSPLESRLLAAVTGHTTVDVLRRLYSEEADVAPALQHLAAMGLVTLVAPA